MNVEIKELFCTEWEFDKEIILEENKTISVSVYVGPVGTNIKESFTVTVCNINYISNIIKKDGCFNGLWHLVLKEAKREIIEKYFQNKINDIKGDSWEDCYKKLRLIGKSEFEDYQKYDS